MKGQEKTQKVHSDTTGAGQTIATQILKKRSRDGFRFQGGGGRVQEKRALEIESKTGKSNPA